MILFTFNHYIHIYHIIINFKVIYGVGTSALLDYHHWFSYPETIGCEAAFVAEKDTGEGSSPIQQLSFQRQVYEQI